MEYTEDKDNDIKIDRSFGLTADRIQSLNDSIFAFAMTLLVLGVQLPTTIIRSQLSSALFNLQPELATYALSFIALGGLWIAHHNQYHWIKKSNRAFLWINILYLFFIVLVPFSTKILAEYHTETLAVLIYGLNLVICLGVLYFHWSYATKDGRLIEESMNGHIVKLIKARIIFTILAIIVSMAVSFLFVKTSIALLLLAQSAVIVPTFTIDRFISWLVKSAGLHSKT